MAGFAHGSSTDVFSTSFGGSSPRRRMPPSVASTPRSATRNERIPRATPRRTSATARSTPAAPRATPPAAEVTSDCPPVSQAPRGPRKSDTSTPCVRAEPRHLVELGVGEHHHAAALRDPPHRHAAPLGLVEHRSHHAAAPRRRGSRSGSGGRPRSAASLIARPSPEGSNAAGSLGSASTSRTSPSSIRKSSTWSRSSGAPVALAARAVQRRRPVVARRARRSAREPVRARRLLRQPAEERGRSPRGPVNVPAIVPSPGHDPRGVLARTAPRSAKPSLRANASKMRRTSASFSARRARPVASQRSIRPST